MVSKRGTTESRWVTTMYAVLYSLPYPRMRSILHLGRVQSVTAMEQNLIMMNLQMARERVNQMETVWIMRVKLVWKSRKIPQAREY